MPEEANEEKTFTQSELDAIVKERIERERKKYADYDDVSKKAKAYDEAQETPSTVMAGGASCSYRLYRGGVLADRVTGALQVVFATFENVSTAPKKQDGRKRYTE